MNKTPVSANIEHQSSKSGAPSNANLRWLEQLTQLGASPIRPPMRIPRLLVRLDAYKNSNRQDHLMRIAKANILDGILDLCKSLKTTFETLVSLSDGELNDFLSGTPLQAIAESGALRVHARALGTQAMTSYSRICPKCIAAGMPSDRYLNLALPVTCPTHGILPIDRCPACNRPTSYFRRAIQSCNCGFSLAQCKTNRPPGWLKSLYAILAPWHLVASPGKEFAEVAVLDSHVGRLIRLLISDPGQYLGRPRTGKPRISSDDFAPLERLISEWPQSFERVFGVYLREGTFKDRGRLLRRFLWNPSPLLEQAVKREREKYEVERKNRISNALVTGVLNGMPLIQVKKLAGMDAATARKFMESGPACPPPTEGKQGRRGFWVNSKCAQEITNYLSMAVHLDDAAKALGCTTSHVRALEELKWLEAEWLSVKPISPRFKAEVLENWLNRLRRHAIPVREARDKTCSLVKVPVRFSNGRTCKFWIKLMRNLLERKVVLYASNEHGDMSCLRVRVADLLQLGMRKKYLLKYLD